MDCAQTDLFPLPEEALLNKLEGIQRRNKIRRQILAACQESIQIMEQIKAYELKSQVDELTIENAALLQKIGFLEGKLAKPQGDGSISKVCDSQNQNQRSMKEQTNIKNDPASGRGPCRLAHNSETVVAVPRASKSQDKPHPSSQSPRPATAVLEMLPADPKSAAEPQQTRADHEAELASGPDDIEPLSGIALRNRVTSAAIFTSRMAGRRLIRLGNVTVESKGTESIAGDWVTVGIIGNKSEPRTSKIQSKYIVVTLTDLKGTALNLFLWKSAFEKHWKILPGTVVAMLNPRIKLPTQTTGVLGLNLDDSNQLMEIGTSKYFAYCQGLKRVGSLCQEIIDLRHGEYCKFHATHAYRQAKSNRPELSLSDSVTPSHKELSKRMHARNHMAMDSSYVMKSGEVLSISDSGCAHRQKGQGGKRESVVIEEQMMQIIQFDSSAGARALKRARGIEVEETGADPKLRLVSNDFVSRMGFDPITGQTVRTKPIAPGPKATTESTDVSRGVILDMDSDDEGSSNQDSLFQKFMERKKTGNST
ncbi:uncharacterized protein BJ171DRAFT_502502 [Polychytrium aggregatum]|uniref:uncharacterized protein n=1 Tax=Polychytrium aggregatum TaxID=110093 RepID=UPI0022FEFF7D|nr:uncharacterized protein BJ171DRAFT_502502 [Polychytrium aggregatum]KAI9204965.1 hypothetical protein BJ171DRAFT_502502 [Polychytrium aggregatum]